MEGEFHMLSYTFFLDLAIILIAGKFFGTVFRRIGLPQVVGMLVAGLLIGPNVLGIVHTSDFLLEMAELGVIMIMFMAGLETDLKELKATGPAALLIAALGVIVPLSGGYLIYNLFHGFAEVGSHAFYEAIFMGVIITATSVGITVETLREMGKLKGKVGTAIVSAAIIDDIIGIILLTVVIGLKDPASNPLRVLASTGAFFILAGVGGFLVYKLFKYLDGKYPERRRVPIYGLAVCLFLSYVAEHLFGIADITGAFVAGIILCNIHSSEYIAKKIDTSSYMLFGPIFFCSIGIRTQISGVTFEMLGFSLLFVAVALLTKIVGCGFGAKVCHFNTRESLRIGVGMMARGEVALIVAQKGLNAGLMDGAYFTPVIFLVIISSVMTPVILKVLYHEPKVQVEGIQMVTSH